MSPLAPVLHAQGLRVDLGGRTVLHGVDCALAAGCWTAVVGPNGAGKSTLLRALAGLLPARGGGVRLLGRPLAEWPARQRAQRIAWMAQQPPEAAEALEVREVARLGRLPYLGLAGAPGGEDERIVDQALALAGCGDWGQRRLDTLSGGERQRALLARALAVQAPVLLLDEPTLHLDPPHQVALLRLLQRLAHEQGLAVASVLHDVSLALQADRLLVLQAGHVRAEGPPDDAGVRQALEEVFGRALRIERWGDRWIAVPEL